LERRRRARYLRLNARKSSKSGTFWAGKIIPRNCKRPRNDGNGSGPTIVSEATRIREKLMYIGLGGLLLLILILWLLGVI